MATAGKKKQDVVLTDKAEKFYVIIKNEDKETKKEFPSEEEALSFIPMAMELKKKANHLRIMFRVSYGDEFLYPPHRQELLYDHKGNVLINPFKHHRVRKTVRMPQVKGKLYCPECGFHTTFKLDSVFGIKRCEGCGLSTNDFDVKTCNGLWESFYKNK
jgi:hypothetical protein